MHDIEGYRKTDYLRLVSETRANASKKSQPVKACLGCACRVGVAVGLQGWAAGEGTY